MRTVSSRIHTHSYCTQGLLPAKNLSTKHLLRLADDSGSIQSGEPKASPASAAPVPPAAPAPAHCRGWGEPARGSSSQGRCSAVW